MVDSESVIPPPWSLAGDGYMVFYRKLEQKLSGADRLFIPPDRVKDFSGGWGVLMLVDYRNSNVGPYRELLLIPGRFRLAGRRRYSITRIFVSSPQSVVSGRTNWAIPKELAEFTRESSGHEDRWTVSQGGRPFFKVSCTLRSRWWVPFSTKWTPSLFLAQASDKKILLTRLQGQGRLQPANITIHDSDGTIFPDLRGIKPVFALKVNAFDLNFAIPSSLPESPT